ncbi:MAG: LytTR family DNA-binding domain-containing protein [Peptococcaceae bacterium]|nr:LytTR family DNA-binding domain-containing protein [Peptococcaceae bacterium]MDH7526311.1 LytTR family DNA-binding domain-containing protein [Peptococcaceae bacterium]
MMIVDDEPPSQAELSYIINQHPDFTVAGVAGSGKEAFQLLSAINPQVAFLDIQLYDINGLELAEKILSVRKDTFIVFATAHDNFAVKAYDLNATDYVVKPFDELRIYKTLDRIRSYLSLKKTQEKLPPPGRPLPEENLDRICAVDSEKWCVVDCSKIVYIVAEERKTSLKLHQNSLPSIYTLKELYRRLNKRDFLQVHRSYVVNLRYIKEIIPWFHGSYKLVMDDKEKSEVPVSRSFAKQLKQKLGIKPGE